MGDKETVLDNLNTDLSKEEEESVFFQEQEFPPAPKSVEKKDGIDVYRLPSQTIETATVSPPKQPQKRAPIPSSRNPRFKPPQ